MNKLKFLGISAAMLVSGHAFAGGQVIFEMCESCNPADANDPVTHAILVNDYPQTQLGDIVSIMQDIKDPVTNARFVANWKHEKGTFVRVQTGSAQYANAPGGGAGTDGRIWVSVGLVLVMYPEPPPLPSVTVEGVFEGSIGGGGGGCTLHESETDCASLDSVNPDGGGAGGPVSQ